MPAPGRSEREARPHRTITPSIREGTEPLPYVRSDTGRGRFPWPPPGTADTEVGRYDLNAAPSIPLGGVEFSDLECNSIT